MNIDATDRHGSAAADLINAKRILWLRTIAVPAPAVLLIIASFAFGDPAPFTQLLVIVGVLIAVNTWTWHRLQGPRPLSDREFFAQMLIDAVALTGTLYYSGGAVNPLALFFLLPLTITATVLPRRYTWAMAAITVGCYAALIVMRRPLPPFLISGEYLALDLHVVGMWVGFVLTAVLIAHYVAGIRDTLRERDQRLADARERTLQDERVFAMATLAAGAAHEISTPLATMSVVTGELEHDLQTADPETRRHLAILRTQILRCKDALSVLSAAAGADRAGTARPELLPAFLDRLVEQIRTLRPGATIDLAMNGQSTQAPRIAADRTLEQAITNLVNNAVDVSPRQVSVRGSWDASRISLEILDRGPGLNANSTAPSEGLGVGLMLTRAIVDHLGGSLEFRNREGGGTCARVDLPLERLQIHA